MNQIILIILVFCLFYFVVRRLIAFCFKKSNELHDNKIIGQSKTKLKNITIDKEKIDELIKLKDDKAAKALARKLNK
ncbi:hypothetical protein [Myroides injenensis]|uniref:hypothetical protein n=1 Tax=Myroides injenensis TaxID=1183151 RepID=UPI00226FB2B6|nr:hypothetical protein [Myroides injenensis]